ncbi:hypothetical protein RAS1_07000 [Phycisphaerae bacterium RAS1]|nr:hypothetical protein RAS1_07000 [Phycisphaerae bacterium RAS1]
MAFEHDPIVALGKDPIRADGPAGDPVRYDTDFEQLQAQLDRLGSLTGEEVQWSTVVDLATQILQKKSKDLLVLTYLVLGIFNQNGYAGLAAGLDTYNEFLKNFWEKCYPKVKPPHGRFNSVQYLIDKLLPSIEIKSGQIKREPTAGEKPAVHKCAELGDQLSTTVTACFREFGPDQQPAIAQFVRALKSLRDKVGPLVDPKAAAAAAAAAAAPAAGAAPAGEGGAAPAAGGGGMAVPETFASAQQATQTVVKIAKYLFTQDNKDARAYRLARAVHFGGLPAPPKSGLLPPPPKPRRDAFDKMIGDGEWAQLLTETENQFLLTPLWIDMQRYIASALKALGAPHQNAYMAVVLDTLALQARFPQILDVTFKDGTPFADGATKGWLADVGKEHGIGSGGSGGGSNGDALSAALTEARKLLTESKPADAVGRLAGVVESSGVGRQRFRAQLALADFCMGMNKLTLAAPILEGLETEIEHFHVDEWEPDLAATALRNLYECMTKLKQKPTPDEFVRMGGIFARLCRLDPKSALSFDAAKK